MNRLSLPFPGKVRGTEALAGSKAPCLASFPFPHWARVEVRRATGRPSYSIWSSMGATGQGWLSPLCVSSCVLRSSLHLWEQLHLTRPQGGAGGTGSGWPGCLATGPGLPTSQQGGHPDVSPPLSCHDVGWPSRTARHVSKHSCGRDS